MKDTGLSNLSEVVSRLIATQNATAKASALAVDNDSLRGQI
jgi:hypothetical protein